MGLISRLLLQGPLACEIFRVLWVIHESEGNSRKDLNRVQISILTHCYPPFITLQSPAEDQAATAETRLFVLLQPNFCLLWPVFTPRFRFSCGRISSLVSMWLSSYTKPDSSKSFTKYYWKNKQNWKRSAGIRPTQSGHRVTQGKSLTLPFQLQAWIMSRAFPVARQTPGWNPLWVTVPGPRRWEQLSPSIPVSSQCCYSKGSFGSLAQTSSLVTWKAFQIYFIVIEPLHLLISHILDSIFHHTFLETSILTAEESWHCYLPTLTTSSCHSLDTHQTKPHFKIQTSIHFSLPVFSVGLVLWFSLEAGDNLVPFSGSPSRIPIPSTTRVLRPHLAPRKESHSPHRPGTDPRQWNAAGC